MFFSKKSLANEIHRSPFTIEQIKRQPSISFAMHVWRFRCAHCVSLRNGARVAVIGGKMGGGVG